MSRATAISYDTVGSQGIYMGISRTPPGQRSTAHVHANCETALYVAAGQGRFLVGPRVDRALPLEAGDCLYVPPNAPHVVINDGDVALVFVVSRTAQVEQVVEYDADHAAIAESRSAAPLALPLLLDRCKTCRVPIRGPRSVLSRVARRPALLEEPPTVQPVRSAHFGRRGSRRDDPVCGHPRLDGTHRPQRQ